MATCAALLDRCHSAGGIEGLTPKFSGAEGVRCNARLGLVADAKGLTQHTKPMPEAWAFTNRAARSVAERIDMSTTQLQPHQQRVVDEKADRKFSDSNFSKKEKQ